MMTHKQKTAALKKIAYSMEKVQKQGHTFRRNEFGVRTSFRDGKYTLDVDLLAGRHKNMPSGTFCGCAFGAVALDRIKLGSLVESTLLTSIRNVLGVDHDFTRDFLKGFDNPNDYINCEELVGRTAAKLSIKYVGPVLEPIR